MSNIKAYLTLILCCIGICAHAKPPQFLFPLDCKLEDNCWSVNYVDTDPQTDQVADFRCGPRSYDGHKGTDFALASEYDMRQGVNVLAAQDGKILRLRTGMSDSLKTKTQLEAIRAQNRDCGNGILIDHGAALHTMYCHLKEGSITVQEGDQVKAGDVIAQTGQSGYAEFPHLHFSVMWEGSIIDPYTGLTNQETCGGFKRNLWTKKQSQIPDYSHAAIFHGGFRDHVPNFTAIKAGERNPDILPKDGKALIFWVGFYGVQKNDVLNIQILDPDGEVFRQNKQVIEKNQARYFYFTGRKLQGRVLNSGIYKGQVSLERQGMESLSKAFTVELR